LKPTDWIADSGTSSHISNSRDLFIDFTPLANHTITGLGEHKVMAIGKGTVKLDFKVDGNYVTNVLKDVLYTPEAANSLLSISKLDDAGGEAIFRRGWCTLTNAKGTKLATAKKMGKLYILDVKPRDEDHANISSESTETWNSLHRKYGHLSISSLEKLVNSKLISGLAVSPNSPPFTQCEACIQAKQHRQPYPKESEDKTTEIGELTHSDVWGPARVAAIPSHLAVSNAKYYISFTDDFSRRCTVFFMKHKSEATQCVKDYITYLERHKTAPKSIRVDNGGEYINKELIRWCKEKGIDLQTTAPYSPSQNGIAERFNRTLMELTRAMLIARNLPSFLWAEAVQHTAYIRNRSPTRALNGQTPHEVWSGNKPNMSHLREFGYSQRARNLAKLWPNPRSTSSLDMQMD
jgi:transposase InsO family protein